MNFLSAFSCRSMNYSAGCSCNNRAPARNRLTEHEHDYDDEQELRGWVTERSIVHAWKACVPQGTRGSNPLPSVKSSSFLNLILIPNPIKPRITRISRIGSEGAEFRN